MLELLDSQLVRYLISLVPAVLATVVGYLRSTRLDRHAATSEGWRALDESRQAEIKSLREQVAALKASLP